MLFLELSPELIERILYELPARDLLACTLLSKFIYTTIRGSIRLVYKVALMAFGAEDNIFSTLSTNVKLDSLQNSQLAWINLIPRCKYQTDFPIAFVGTNVALGGGILLYGTRDDSGDHRLNLLQLMTSNDLEPGAPIDYSTFSQQSWNIYGDRSSRKLLAYGPSLREHGLLAEVHSEWEGEKENATTFKISIYLRPHPGPTPGGSHHVYVMDCPTPHPFVALQIVGKHIVIIVGVPEDDEDNGQDNIFVYDFISDVL